MTANDNAPDREKQACQASVNLVRQALRDFDAGRVDDALVCIAAAGKYARVAWSHSKEIR